MHRSNTKGYDDKNLKIKKIRVWGWGVAEANGLLM